MILTRALAIMLAIALGALGWQTVRLAAAQREMAAHLQADAEAAAAAERSAREAERAATLRHNQVVTQLEKERDDAIAKADSVRAELRAGTLRLRDHWRGCPADVPGAPAAAAGRDEGAELRAAGASDLVQLAAEADARLRACQAVIRADRE